MSESLWYVRDGQLDQYPVFLVIYFSGGKWHVLDQYPLGHDLDGDAISPKERAIAKAQEFSAEFQGGVGSVKVLKATTAVYSGLVWEAPKNQSPLPRETKP